jgi:hypothetical protein
MTVESVETHEILKVAADLGSLICEALRNVTPQTASREFLFGEAGKNALRSIFILQTELCFSVSEGILSQPLRFPPLTLKL